MENKEDETQMFITGILLDVSGSMRSNIGSGCDEEGEPWARSIFKVINDLIKHDVTSENEVFALGVGASCGNEIFDVIGTVQQLEKQQMPEYCKNMFATKDHINKILLILESNGARNIRQWASIALIREVVSDHMAALILMKLESDGEFCRTFVNEYLPRSCRDVLPEVPQFEAVSNIFQLFERFFVHGVTLFVSATIEDIVQVVEKAKSYFLKHVGDNSIFSVQDASRIIHGCLDETELSKERSRELLESVEPFIYGRTPLYQSLEKAIELFQRSSHKYPKRTKLLFVLSDGDPTDGCNENPDKINQVISKLKEESVKVVSCFINKATDIQPKRLYNEMLPNWELGAKFLFSLSSEVPTQHLPRAILVKRGWTIDVANNETKLFLQANHPDNLREACDMAGDVVCCPDALSDLLVSVDLDIYISQSNDSVEAKKQVGGTCYANASAAVLHLAMKRILGREGGYPDFHALREEIIKRFGSHGANTIKVLQEICPKYRLHCRNVNLNGAMQSIVEKQPVVAKFRLTEDEWKNFKEFYKNKNNRYEILTEKVIDTSNRSTNATTSGHAVVLTSFNSKCLTLMNSWGPGWADLGFFRVQKAKLLKLEFIEVYWTLADLTKGEKAFYDDNGAAVATQLMTSLKGLQKAEYTCPICSETSSVTAFTGTLSIVKCPKCSQEFSTNDNAGNILALNMYLTSVYR